MSHKLALNIEDGVNNNKFIHVRDISIYDQVLGVKHRILQVLPPFSDLYVILDFPTSSHFAFSSVDLKLTDTEQVDLPDGLYQFHFSVAPNEKVNLVYPYFRTAVLMNRIYSEMIKVATDHDDYVDDCGNITFEKYQNVLLHNWMLLKGVQSLGRQEINAAKAQDLYNQALRSINKLTFC